MSINITKELNELEQKAKRSKRARRKLIAAYKHIRYRLKILKQLHFLKHKGNIDKEYLQGINKNIEEINQKLDDVGFKEND